MEVFKLFGTIAVKNAEANKAIEETASRAKKSRSGIVKAVTGIDVGIDNNSALSNISETQSLADTAGRKIDDDLSDLSVDIETQTAEKNLSAVADKTDETESRMSGALKKIGAAVAAAFAIDKIKDFGQACVESAAAVQAENSQFEQTFGDMQSQAEEAINGVAQSSGILDTRLKTVGTSIYAFAKTTGMDSTDSLNLMNDALQVTADSAAYYDRSLEDTAESLKSFLKGNFENDAALGLSCTETTRNAKATELFGKKFIELSEAQKQVALLEMVKDANELSGAMGQAARESDGYENVMGNLKESVRQFQAVVGAPVLEKVVPIIQKLTKGISEMGNKFQSAKKWCSEHKTELELIGIVVGTLTAAIIAYNIAQNAAAIATGIATAATAAFGAVLAFVTSPITLIILAIGALIAIGVLLYKNWDEVKEIAQKVWNKITEFVSNAWQKIKDVFGGIADWFSEKFNDAWEGIKNAFSSVGEFFSGLWDAIKSKFTYIGTQIGESVSGAFKAVINGALNTVESIINGFFDGINWAIDVINNIPGVDINPIEHVNLPELAEGGVLPKGKTGYLEGDGDEAVVPLEKNTGWTSKVAKYIAAQLPDSRTALENYGSADNSEMESRIDILSEKMDKIISLISTFYPQLLDKFEIVVYLDGDKLAVKLAPKIDKELGERVKITERGLVL